MVHKASRHTVIACLLAALAACAGKDAVVSADEPAAALADFRSAVEVAVADDAVEAEVLALLNALETDIVSMGEAMQQSRAEIRRINASYDTTREEMAALVDEATLRILNYRNRILAARQRLAEVTTPEQRQAIRSAEVNAARAIADSLQVL